ncbi:dephospho-CoA kinase [Rhodobacteraceae bacterium WD3A24]|nr:dephospho-CoA kinase [Rhodobacteraceae bacterium WD3A24]
MSRPFVLGLTGSVAMGKSTTATMFAEEGVPVWDADAAVHRLYARGGAGVAAVAELCPEAVRDGAVDREALRAWLGAASDRFAALEAAIHPLVAADRTAFLETHATRGTPLVVLDMPLLFETGGENLVDAVAVATTATETQRARVLDRPGMTEAAFETIRARQTPDAEKRARADYIIETDSFESARAAVRRIIAALTEDRDA